jgi:hypothetical protein
MALNGAIGLCEVLNFKGESAMSEHAQYLRPNEVYRRYGVTETYVAKLVKAKLLRPMLLPALGKRSHRRFAVADLEKCFCHK